MIRNLLIANRGEIARRIIGVGLMLVSCSFGVPAFADDLPIRSDIPLWGENDEGVWPQRIEGSDEIGVTSAFAIGDWRRVSGDCVCDAWINLKLSGVFHPGYLWRGASGREALPGVESEITLIASLETGVAHPHLFAIELGMWGGSRYLLISLDWANGSIKRFTLLDPICDVAGDAAHVRKAAFETVYRTEYCAVDSQAALLAIAREATTRPPQAAYEWVGERDKSSP